MTTPSERLRALYLAREFLASLLDPKKTPGVPRAIRKEASTRLKHYPMPCDLDEMLRERKPARMHPFTCTTSGGGTTYSGGETYGGSSYMNFLAEALAEDLARIRANREKVSRRDTPKKSKPKKAITVINNSNREPGYWL